MNNDQDTGIPTRAIHEAYLDMQRALKAYRESKDAQNQYQMQEAHGELQQSVLTFYELLRPHLKKENSVKGWWDGQLPTYNHDMTPVDPNEGKGILQVQEKTRTLQLNGNADPDELDHFRDWHDALGLNGNTRLTGLAKNGTTVLLKIQEYQKGLQHLDSWETKYERKTTRKSGFMGHESEETIERKRIPIDRLIRAARELADAADKLSFLSDTGTPINEDTRPI